MSSPTHCAALQPPAAGAVATQLCWQLCLGEVWEALWHAVGMCLQSLAAAAGREGQQEAARLGSAAAVVVVGAEHVCVVRKQMSRTVDSRDTLVLASIL
jgi:hypothetical protein